MHGRLKLRNGQLTEPFLVQVDVERGPYGIFTQQGVLQIENAPFFFLKHQDAGPFELQLTDGTSGEILLTHAQGDYIAFVVNGSLK